MACAQRVIAYNGFPLPATEMTPACGGVNPNSPLAQRLTVQWSGKASTLLSSLASRWGWSFDNRLTKLEHDPDVSIDARHQMAAGILAQVAEQTPRSTVIKVLPGEIVLEDRAE